MKAYDRRTDSERRTDEIVQRYGKNPERICQAARSRGIDTDSWYIAASELAKREEKGYEKAKV